MSVRKYSFLFPLIVFVALLFFSNTNNEASPDLQPMPPQTKEDIEALIQVGPGVDDPEGLKKQKLAEKIFADYAKLKELFDSNDPKLRKKMAKKFGKKATIVTPGDKRIRKLKNIEEYWTNVPPEYLTVQFILKWAYIVFEEKETEEMDDYDHIAYESFYFHLYEESQGKILKNRTGRGERSCRHTQICDCITR
jgi:hypothetical protein